MTKSALYVLLFFIGVAQSSYGQLSKKDSSNAEIKQQAVEMRIKLDKYMAEKLGTTTPNNSTPYNQLTLDSFRLLFKRQHEELQELKSKFELLEHDLTSGKYAMSNNRKSDSAYTKSDRIKNTPPVKYEQPNNKLLIVYFPFDEYELTDDQIQTIQQFIAKQTKTKSITLYGYTDWVGNEKYNKQLKLDRCLAVRRNLKTKSSVKIVVNRSCSISSPDTSPDYCRKVEIVVK
ncbi:MAG: hypothetical protein EAY81_06640 [Bacteroidetes bacterium]|nr:MAG: hypothetical protein EAY81_06640 [Bacteroidota bacterium]